MNGLRKRALKRIILHKRSKKSSCLHLHIYVQVICLIDLHREGSSLSFGLADILVLKKVHACKIM